MITVRPDPARRSGRALIRVSGAAAALGTPDFRIRREGWEAGTLGPQGWQVADAILQPDRAEADGGDLLLHVGWPVCEHLENDIYQLAVPAAGIEGQVFWPDIVPLHGGTAEVVGVSTAPTASAPRLPVVEQEPAPVPVTASVNEKVQPNLTPAAPRASGVGTRFRSFTPLIAAVLILAVGGAGWFAWHHQQAGQEPQRPGPARPVPSTADSAPTHAASASASLDDMSVPDVLAHAPGPADITAQGQRRLQGGHRDDGLLLLESAADRGEPGAMAALAALYDPLRAQPGSPVPPDARQAARYYRDATHAGASGLDVPREALHTDLQKRAHGGDLPADLTLRDFWP